MASDCLLYYITDRSQFAGDEAARRRALLDKIREAAHAGVDYIQLREKDLSVRELEQLAREVKRAMSLGGSAAAEAQRTRTRLLINSRTDVAFAIGADGVHLRSDDVSPTIVRSIWRAALARAEKHIAAKPEQDPLVAVSCHSPSDVLRAGSEGADLAVFAPVFEKKDASQVLPQGLVALREACTTKIPVFALGGITLENAASCVEAGAAGIAGIRLFQENRIEEVVATLAGVLRAR